MKLKNKKGFTLIELLAVIVVLAIIALIATPIVMNTIKNAKKGAAERTADNYIKQVETAVAEAKLENKSVPNGTYDIDGNGNLTGAGLPDGKLEIDMSGNKPSGGTLTISNGGVSKEGTTMTVGDYDVKYNQEKNKYEATEKGSTSVTYKNGQEVYFNVDNGTKCTSSEAVSTTGTKSGCMKFYAFNDDGGDTINLILDHNTTATVAWISKEDYVAAGGTESYYGNNGKNDKGPLTLLSQLKNDTKTWVGTVTPSNYTMDQTGQTSNTKYIIDYSSYKARLITAQEIATITGNTSWDEEKEENSNYYYLDSKTTSQSSTCKSGDTSGCSYGWLYDRTNTSCTESGCLNNSDQKTSGYWTISSRAAYMNAAWYVSSGGFVDAGIVGNVDRYGVRPVITVLKSNLS